jgi:hypothetical protein
MAPLDLRLMHGQVAWALARGQPPSEQLIDQLRYLRQLGVPFSKAELGAGSGHRIRYGFDHLIELGVAVFGLERGMRPREVAKILVDHRAELRRCYRDTLAVLPENAFTDEWVKSRGATRGFCACMIGFPSGQDHSNSSRVIHWTPFGNSPR